MENLPNQQPDLEIAQTHEDPGSRQFKGIRLRKWGRWVSEIRIPKSREKIWLGSYTTPEQAARAYDAAVYCLKGPNAKFNFPESVHDIPSVTSVSRQEIQHAALKYALGQPPPSLQSLEGHAALKYALGQPPPSLQSLEGHAALKYSLGQPPPSLQSLQGHASPSQSSTVSEIELSGEQQKISEECPDIALWSSLLGVSDDTGIPNSEKFPSIDEYFSATLQEQREEDYISTNLWNFQDQDV